MALQYLQKKNGQTDNFDRSKLEKSISAACIAANTEVTLSIIAIIANEIIGLLEQQYLPQMPRSDYLRQLVHEKLLRLGLKDAAFTYISYEKISKPPSPQPPSFKVQKRDGQLEDLDITKIEKRVKNYCHGCSNEINLSEIIKDCTSNLYDGIKTTEIEQAILLTVRGRIEKSPAYSMVAARCLLNQLYREVLNADEFNEQFKELYTNSFKLNLKEGVESGRLDRRVLEFNLDALSRELKPDRDKLFNYLGMQTLYDRYFLRDLKQHILETPQYFWMRIAMGLALNEENKEEKAIEFYHAMSPLLYIPSTPTLFHSGTRHPQMSSCYLTTVEDDLLHIFKCIGDNAQLSKWSGGLGNDWSNIRGTGAQIKSTNVGSQGVIPFLKIVDAATAAINRSGKRRGAACVYLETWHYDIEDFLELRKNTGDDRRRTHDTNTAHWIPDLFIKRVLSQGDWTLFSADETPDLHHLYGKAFERKYEEYERKAQKGQIKLYKTVKAVDLWRKMITMLFETGHPWITFKDPCNIRSPQDHAGVIHSSNLCTEITLNTSAEETAVCNLGSLNLPQFIADGQINTDLFRTTIKTAVRMLDNVIDLNYYPTKEAQNSNIKHRPIGLGIMGFQDLLYRLNLPFDSAEAVDLSDRLMELIAYHAVMGSAHLAQERGAYSSFRGSKWDRGVFPCDTIKLLEEERGTPTGIELTSRLDWNSLKLQVKTYGMRNSNCLAIAPTATISNIVGSLPSIEPIYKNIYVKSNVSGEFTVINEYLIEDLAKLGLWNEAMIQKIKYHDGSIQKISEIPEPIRAKYKEVFEIDPHWMLLHAAVRGKWIDQSQSINIFCATNSGKVLSDIYLEAWKLGLKTTYYLRGLAASSVEKSTLDINKKYDNHDYGSEAPKKNITIAKEAVCEA
ncbi:MAG: ribonucleoside-diphosphate reductase subunit alpha, partial [Parcubacteria group bacterium]|nr:ribonucleoside-diphosphate reductase subunit alpha [Parcubacteria group bacterium]